jgi:hypothetical protein
MVGRVSSDVHEGDLSAHCNEVGVLQASLAVGSEGEKSLHLHWNRSMLSIRCMAAYLPELRTYIGLFQYTFVRVHVQLHPSMQMSRGV